MKNLSLLAFEPYMDPATENEISNFGHELEIIAVTTARTDALKGFPGSTEEFSIVVGGFRAKVNEVVQTLSAKSQINSLVAIGREPDQSADELQILNNDVAETSIQTQVLSRRISSLDPVHQMKAKRVLTLIGIVLIGIAEGFLAFSAFRFSGLNKLSSFMASVAVTLTILGTHIPATYLKLAATKQKQIVIFIVTSVLYAFGFWGLVYLRSSAVAKMNVPADNVIDASLLNCSCLVLTLFSISFLLWLVGFIGSIWAARTREEAAREREYVDLEQRLEKLQNNKQAALDRIQEIEVTTKANRLDRMQRVEYALSVERRLAAMAENSVQTYIRTNNQFRSTGTPAFFANPPAMTFNTSLFNSKNY